MSKNNIIFLLIVFSVFITSLSFATIINIPADFPTIQQGIDSSIDGDTVLVQPGTYIENINFNGHNIVLGSLFLTTQNENYINQTVIDGDSSATVVSFTAGESGGSMLIGFKVTNGFAPIGAGILCDNQSSPVIANNYIFDNFSYQSGGGIACLGSSNPVIRENIIEYNYSRFDGGGIYCVYASPTIENNEILHNITSAGGGIFLENNANAIIRGNYIHSNTIGIRTGGGIQCETSSPLIIDNYIIFNEASDGSGITIYQSDAILSKNRVLFNTSRYAGGGIFVWYSVTEINNSIIAYNSSSDWGGGGIAVFSGPASIKNCVIYSNHSVDSGGGISVGWTHADIVNTICWGNESDWGEHGLSADIDSATVTYCNIQDVTWPGEGNINVDPLFRLSNSEDFRLMSNTCGDTLNSPCIDTGNPAIEDFLLDCDWGLGGLRSDMGAYGGGDLITVGIDDPLENIPQQFMILQNYPNPFNALTTIRYLLPSTALVKLEIYDILGRKIETLIDQTEQVGVHSIRWDAGNYPSGVYFARLQTGTESKNIRMLMIK